MTGKTISHHLKEVGMGVLGIGLFIGWIVVYNVGLDIFEGKPGIPTLENRWWGGYYDLEYGGRQWCVARFSRQQDGNFDMALLSSFGQPEIFEVTRRSSNEKFVYLTFKDTYLEDYIDAKQLYVGKKYMLQRFFVGRWSDFWKRNDDVSIRGSFRSTGKEFALEPISQERLLDFWQTYVRTEEGEPTPAEILQGIGFLEKSDP